MEMAFVVKPQNEKLLPLIVERVEKQMGVISVKTFIFTPQRVEEMYPEKLFWPYFKTLTNYLSSGVSYAILVDGQVGDALAIKGKTFSGQGIRGQFAVDFVRNILHCPDTGLQAAHELSLLRQWW